jgi:hypothetical protein
MLAILWDRPSATGRAIDEALLDRVVQKGYLDGHPAGEGRGTSLYTAVVSRTEVRHHPDLIAQLVRVWRLTPAECTHECAAHGHLSQQDTVARHTR